MKLRVLRGPTLGAIRRMPGWKAPAIRRPLSLRKPIRSLERLIRTRSEAMAARVSALLREDGVLERLAADAERRAEKRQKGPVGRGGRPLGPERTRELRQVFEFKEMQAVATLVEDEENAFKLELAADLEDEYADLFELGGAAARRALGVSGSFNLRSPAIAEALAERANQLSGNVSDDVFERLKTVLADQFYIQGNHPFDVAAVLEDEFDWMSRQRAELIARTEAGAVTEEAQWMTYEASGVPYKRWLTTLDGREREDHFEAHGQIRPIDEPFEVGGEDLMYPLDPEGSAKQVCNCRCTQIPIIVGDQVVDESTVWDGENDPDEFAKEKRLVRQPTRWELTWLRKDREYVRDEGGRFSETEGGAGGGTEGEAQAGAEAQPKPTIEERPGKTPRMTDEAYNAGVNEMQRVIAESLGVDRLVIPSVIAETLHGGNSTAAIDEAAQKLGPAFFERYYEENPGEYDHVVNHMAEAWAHIGGEGPSSLRLAAQSAFGVEASPVWDSKASSYVTKEDLKETTGGELTSYAGAMRREWNETQDALESGTDIKVEVEATLDDWENSDDFTESWDIAKEAEWDSMSAEDIADKYYDQDEHGQDMLEWAEDHIEELDALVQGQLGIPREKEFANLSEEDAKHLAESGIQVIGTTPAYRTVLMELDKQHTLIDTKLDELLSARAAGQTATERESNAALIDKTKKEKEAILRQISDWHDRSENTTSELSNRQLNEYTNHFTEAVSIYGPEAWVDSGPGKEALYENFSKDFEWDPADQEEAFAEWASRKTTDVDVDLRGETVKLHRGMGNTIDKEGKPVKYVASPVESWSASPSKAREFGRNVMEREIPRQRILTFQGAPSWKAGSEESFGRTEFEFMVLPDDPFWLRKAA